MDQQLKALLIDVGTSFYRVQRFPLGPYIGPVDLGFVLTGQYDSLNFGAGILAGSILPGSNRMIFTGNSPSWTGFYVSSMGGAALVFDNLGVNLVSVIGRADSPSVLYLNRRHGEEVDVEVCPVPIREIWNAGRKGTYGLMDKVMEMFGDRYETDPRILATGPAAASTDIGGIVSVPIQNGVLSFVDTWAGRGGLGSNLFQQHGICAVIYGGTVIDEDFRDRTVADRWFEQKYEKKLAAKDMEATGKYRYDPALKTGGTLGVNFQTLSGKMLSFNYRSIYWDEAERVDLHQHLVLDHYLKQFNEETIEGKQQRTCGEPCSAVCKKMWGPYKKDYEPYQTLGPLIGIFDQRAAEQVNHHADTLGFDAISSGGVLAWIFDALDQGLLKLEDAGLSELPHWDRKQFQCVDDSMHNAKLAVALLDELANPDGKVSLKDGARRLAWRLSDTHHPDIRNLLVYAAHERSGWMVPNQYWTPGVLAPMAMMGKYYMYYGFDYVPPRELGRVNAARMQKELILDNLGICRFHRKWAEEMAPDIVMRLFGDNVNVKQVIAVTTGRINSRNHSMPWESTRNADFVNQFLIRHRDVEGNTEASLLEWIDGFRKDPGEAALTFWYEMHKGMMETLRPHP